MSVLPVRYFGDPVLRSRAEEVTEIDSTVYILVEDMYETMDASGGVGLAANQVGILRRVFVYDCEGQRGHVLNPVWKAVTKETVTNPEGCLSIPGIQKDVERSETVRLTGKTLDGEAVDFTTDGLLARCIQHETDHLDGILFLQRLTPELRKEAMHELRTMDWFMKS